MNLVPGNTRLTADGAVGTSGNVIRVFTVHVVNSGGDSATILRNGTADTDTAFCQVDGVDGTGVTVSFNGGLKFTNGCFLDVGANISYATIIYTEEK